MCPFDYMAFVVSGNISFVAVVLQQTVLSQSAIIV